MEKINILTLNTKENYGGMLQLFALYKTIESLGFVPQVVSKTLPDPIIKTNVLKKLLKFFAKPFLNLLKSKEKAKNCSLFLNNLNHVEPEDAKTSFDKTIVGSDQVWNESIVAADTDFLLEGFSTKNKISYGASFGILNKNSQKWLGKVMFNLKQFKLISCRENNSVQLLKNCGINAALVCDPTMLLSADEWKNFSKNSHLKRKMPSKYIVCYIMPGSKITEKLIRKKCSELSKLHSCPVYYLGNKPTRRANLFEHNIFEAGPYEFIELISNSAYVVTNSFHGASFASYFAKKATIIPTNGSIKNGDDRIPTLLKNLNIDLDINKDFLDIDFSKDEIQNQILKKRKESIKFLEDALRC